MRQDIQSIGIRQDSHEIELKFLTTDAGFKSSQQWEALAEPAPRGAQRLLTRYFDTENADLRRNGVTLRIRKQGRAQLMTLKYCGDFAGGQFERGEVEIPCKSAEPDLALLAPEHSEMLQRLLRDQPLLPVYETDIRRLTRHVATEAGDIEIAFDAGFLRAADRKTPVREIELELKSGDPAELYRLGMALAEAYPVRLGTLAKSERAALLSSDAEPHIAKGVQPLQGELTVDAAIGAVINACIGQFCGNFAAFEAGDAVSAVHQMRVAMRRLRSLLGLFQRSFPCPEFMAFAAEAKRIAGILGQARNWDIFLQTLREGPAAAFPDEPGFAPIAAAAEAKRKAAYQAAAEMLASPATTCFVLSVQAFVARHGWRNTIAPEALTRLTEPARAFAAANINRMHGKLVKKGRHLQRLDAHRRHKVRIGMKKIRYAADLFGGLFGHHELRGLLRSASSLQDQIGKYNDLVTVIDQMRHLQRAPETDYAAGVLAGWCRHGADPDEKTLLRAWKKFKRAKPLT